MEPTLRIEEYARCSKASNAPLCKVVTKLREEMASTVFNTDKGIFDQPSSYRFLSGMTSGFSRYTQDFLLSSFAQFQHDDESLKIAMNCNQKSVAKLLA